METLRQHDFSEEFAEPQEVEAIVEQINDYYRDTSR